MSDGIDHIVYATPDLALGIKRIKELLGVEAIFGGQHRGRGTQNALLALGEDTYLEIIAPDPKQPAVSPPLWMGVDAIIEPKLITWASKSNDLLRLAALASKNNIPIGKIAVGNRIQPDGQELSWQLTEPVNDKMDGLIPFFIDWSSAMHPAASLPLGGTLLSLYATHPEPDKIKKIAMLLGFALTVRKAEIIGLVARIRTNHGVVELR